jgi:hypothetical protein
MRVPSAPHHRAQHLRAHEDGRRSGPPSAEDVLVDLLHIDGRAIPSLTGRQWDRVTGLALHEQVWSLASEAVRTRPGGAVPVSTRTVLERMRLRSAAHAGAAYAQAAGVMSLFRTAGVPAALIKGGALAWFTYGDGGLRPFGDLDLLISPRDRAGAHEALCAAGYATLPAASVAAAGARTYWDPERRRFPVDLHWRFETAPLELGLDYEGMLRRAAAGKIEGEPVLLLSPADMLVALAAHSLKHLLWGQPRLRYLRDIAEITIRCRPEWDQVTAAVARAPKARSPVRLALIAASRLLGARVPDQTIAALAPVRGRYLDRRLAAAACRRLVSPAWPFKASVQIAAMRWLDRDDVGVYLKLLEWVAKSRWHRFASSLPLSGPRS